MGNPAEETYCYPNRPIVGHPQPPCQLDARTNSGGRFTGLAV